MSVRNVFCVVIAVCVSCAFVSNAGARQLNPPPGPVAPTGPTHLNPQALSLPIIIFMPGHYVLTGDFFATPGAFGVEIYTDNVTLDLNGFTLDGAGVGLQGVLVGTGVRNITVRNGRVRGWTSHGVGLVGAERTVIEDVIASDNFGFGIDIQLGRASRCTASGNGLAGFRADRGTVTECTARANGVEGFALFGASVAERCVANDNFGPGFQIVDGSTARACAAYTNNFAGFVLDAGASITDCSGRSNFGAGAFLVNTSRVDRSTFSFNGNAGIEVNGVFNHVEENTCTDNFGQGVFVTGSNNRVSENACAFNTFANFTIAGFGNSIYKNSATTPFTGFNYEILGPNDVGPIGGASVIVSPWANIEY